jgi:alpha-tubulin suppressor-like RCC1 family protein
MTLTGCVADPAPQMVGVVAGDHSATVTWQAPLGIPFPIAAYVVTPLINNVPQTPVRFDSTATTETVTGLTNGTRYTFEVKAINALGNDSASSAASGLAIPPGITAVTTAGEHTCALTGSGTVYCWGHNGSGQLGDGTATDANTPVGVVGIGRNGAAKASQVAAGHDHTCALVVGTVLCWGRNDVGQLGNGTNVGSNTPVAVQGITTATAIAAGADHTCALLAGGTVDCWGFDGDGQLGDNFGEGSSGESTVPVSVIGITTATAIAGGLDHTCAVTADNTVACWGDNVLGQLGNGSTNNEPWAVPATGIGNASAIAAGYDYTCALISDGSVYCWGDNQYGQLGFYAQLPVYNGFPYSDVRDLPVQIDAGRRTATAIAAGDNHTCALADNHGVWCWGLNAHGELGDGTTTNSGNSVQVAAISTATAISAGTGDSCAVVAAGVKCWGQNTLGELGNGTTTDSSTPVPVVWP